MTALKKSGAMAVLLILMAAGSRLMPHPYNFTPVVALALFGGAVFNKKWMGYAIPVAAMLLADVGLAAMGKTGFYGITQLFVYGAMLIITALGGAMGRPRALKVAGYTICSSAIFWIVSNFGVWVANALAKGTPYHEQGLTLGYTYLRALPFYNHFSTQLFFNAFAGDLLYSILLFGIYHVLVTRPGYRPLAS